MYRIINIHILYLFKIIIFNIFVQYNYYGDVTKNMVDNLKQDEKY